MTEYINKTLAKAQFTGDFQETYTVPLIKALIDEVPTADVQEVRHGRWIQDAETGCLICSECGRFTDEIIGDMIEQDGIIIHRSMNPFYCSNCGARMDGKEEQK